MLKLHNDFLKSLNLFRSKREELIYFLKSMFDHIIAKQDSIDCQKKKHLEIQMPLYDGSSSYQIPKTDREFFQD